MALPLSEGIRDLPDFFGWGTLGLIFFGIPILAVVGLFALFVQALQLRSAWAVTLCGTLTSLFTTMLIAGATGGLSTDLFSTWTRNETFGLVGTSCAAAISAWIYWRIAIGRTPPNGHAIEAE